jgi:CheY-like chemotaxis protein
MLTPNNRQDQLAEILVVTEDLFLRKLLRRQLEELGCSVREAVSVQRALDRIQDAPPDLVLLDAAADHGQGAPIVESLRARQAAPSIPVLLLTTEGCPDTGGHALGSSVVAAIPVRRAAVIAPWIEAALPAVRPDVV